MHRGSYYDSVFAIEIKNKIPAFFIFDANLTSVITMELKFIFFLCDVSFPVWRH